MKEDSANYKKLPKLRGQIYGLGVIWSALFLMATSSGGQTTHTAAPTQSGGVANTVPLWLNSKSLGNSVITETSSSSPDVMIGTSQNAAKLTVDGGGEVGIWGQSSVNCLFGQPCPGAGIIGAAQSAYGVEGDSTNNAGIYGESSNAVGVLGHTSGNSNASGVLGIIDAQNPSGAVGVSGVCSSTQGVCSGVAGYSSTPSGVAIVGYHLAATGDAAAIAGYATNTSGNAAGLYAESHSPQSHALAAFAKGAAGAAYLDGGGGNIILGVTNLNPVFRVDGTGRGYFNNGTQVGGADFAEEMQVLGDGKDYTPGDLLEIDANGDRRLVRSEHPYSTGVAGILSTKPGVLGTRRRADETAQTTEVPLAVVGIVPCKVTAENGPIVRGDLLVSSSTSGYAMKGTDRQRMLGAVVGKALEPLKDGRGVIEVLVTLQ